MSLHPVHMAFDKLNRRIVSHKEDLRQEALFLLLYTCAGCLVYYLLISRGLFNHYDGLWHPSRFIAGDWEVSIGRWVWPYIDILRFGLVSPVMNTVISLLLTGLGHSLLFRMFGIRSITGRLLISLLWIGSFALCVSLSYVYMSPTFAAAFLFAVAAAYALVRMHNTAGFVLASCLFALSLGSYQAYSGVTCLILCAFFIVLCSRTKEIGELVKFCLRTVGMIVCGGGLYFAGVKIHLAVRHIALEEYGGASGITAGAILRNLPAGIKMCYAEFYRFFATSDLHYNYFKENKFTFLLFAALIVIMGVRVCMTARRSILHALLMAAGAALLPMAANFVLLIAVGSYIKPQMAGGLCMVPGVLLCMTHLAMSGGQTTPGVACTPDRKTTPGVACPVCAAHAMVTVLTVLLAWAQICSVTNDQLAMEEGRTSVATIADMIANDLMDENVIPSGEKICIIGRPASNELFFKNEAWKQANFFAKFGRWSTAPNCDFYSWRSTFKYLCGLDLNFCSPGEYNDMKASDIVAEMPSYPAEGSISKVDDIVVVKVSNKY